MQLNLDYDLAKPLASALKVKAPYIGIPMPGHAPLTFDRKKLSACLKGVRPTNIEVLTNEDKPGSTHTRWLRVEGYASNGRIRTKLTIKAIPAVFWRSREGKQALRDWRDAEMRERTRQALAPTDRHQAATVKRALITLKRLTKELQILPPYTLYNPTVPHLSGTPSESERQRVSRLQETRRHRTILGAIAAQARREQWSSVQLYKYLTQRGYHFDKLSDMTGRERELKGAEDFRAYLANLHRFVSESGLKGQTASFPEGYTGRHSYRRKDNNNWGPERYMYKLAELQSRRSLQAQIDSVRQILADNGAGPQPVPALVQTHTDHAVSIAA